jgi:hypothetical protein
MLRELPQCLEKPAPVTPKMTKTVHLSTKMADKKNRKALILRAVKG